MKKYGMLLFLTILVLTVCACGRAEAPAETQMTEEIRMLETKESVPEETMPEETMPEETMPEATVPETQPPVFSEEITFELQYVNTGETMPYALITPSTAAQRESVPLIVWLHGKSERDANEAWFMGSGLPVVLRDWSLEGFHAYVLCPELRGQWNDGTWCSRASAQALRQLLDSFIAEHNVDTDHIIIGGFSLGGRGAMYMALELEEYFSKLVVFSSLSLSERDITEIQIPTMGCSEYAVSWNAFMKMEFQEVFGEDSVWFYDATHVELIDVAFNDDKDGNGRSDVVEWMLAEAQD